MGLLLAFIGFIWLIDKLDTADDEAGQPWADPEAERDLDE